MFLHQIHSLRQVLPQNCVYSIEAALFEIKSPLKTLSFSTKSSDSRIRGKIAELNEKELQNVNSKDWTDRISVLKASYFSHFDCFTMITKHPDILRIPLQKFESTVKQWTYSNLKVENVRTILMTSPVLLEVEHPIIRKRLSYLLMMCGSSNLLTDLLVNSPCVMFDDWNVLVKKLDYVIQVRGFQINDVVNSFALSRSLDLIKFRFNLLEKCGIYKQMTLHVHKINKYDKSQHKNPSLKNILELNDNHFSSAVAKISLEEYNFCYELFMAEDDEEDPDEDDDDYHDCHHQQEH